MKVLVIGNASDGDCVQGHASEDECNSFIDVFVSSWLSVNANTVFDVVDIGSVYEKMRYSYGVDVSGFSILELVDFCSNTVFVENILGVGQDQSCNRDMPHMCDMSGHEKIAVAGGSCDCERVSGGDCGCGNGTSLVKNNSFERKNIYEKCVLSFEQEQEGIFHNKDEILPVFWLDRFGSLFDVKKLGIKTVSEDLYVLFRERVDKFWCETTTFDDLSEKSIFGDVNFLLNSLKEVLPKGLICVCDDKSSFSSGFTNSGVDIFAPKSQNVADKTIISLINSFEKYGSNTSNGMVQGSAAGNGLGFIFSVLGVPLLDTMEFIFHVNDIGTKILESDLVVLFEKDLDLLNIDRSMLVLLKEYVHVFSKPLVVVCENLEVSDLELCDYMVSSKYVSEFNAEKISALGQNLGVTWKI